MTIEQFKNIVADLSPSLVKDKVPQWKYAIFKQKELSEEHSKLNLYFEPRFKSDLEGLVRKLNEKGDVAKKVKLKKKIKSTQKTIFACFTNSFSVNEISAHGMKLIKDSIENILGKGKEKFFKSQLHIWMNTSLKPNSDKSKETSSNSGVDTGSNASGKLTTLIYLYDRESFNKILKDYKKFFSTLKDFKYNKSLEE